MDEKIIAVCKDDPNYNMYSDISQLPSHTFEEMRHFFSVYKTLEVKETVVDEVQGRRKGRRDHSPLHRQLYKLLLQMRPRAKRKRAHHPAGPFPLLI